MPLRSAIVHDFFIQDGGAERCAIEFAGLLPEAAVYTSFFDEETFGDRLNVGRVHTWPLQWMLRLSRAFRRLLPLYPLYFGALRLRNFDLVLSSSVAFSKAVKTGPRTRHISYVYTPMRYAWDLDDYLQGSTFSVPARIAARVLRPVLQVWDRRTSHRPDLVVAISQTVADRIRVHWKREPDAVIYPPVDTDEISIGHADDGFFLVAARALPYRRLDLAVDACSRSGRRLVVVGVGPASRDLQRRAGPSVEFMGHVDRGTLVELFRRCRAYVVPGVEDFGIALVEAMAAGKPVVAYRAGGAAETVIHGETGVLFPEQTVQSLEAALASVETMTFDPVRIRARALEFDRSVFLQRWSRLLGHTSDLVGEGSPHDLP